MNAPAKSAGFRVIGTRPVRPDGAEKVTGRALYGPDFSAPGMLHGAILRSPHAHARIRAIDASKALALPGVKAVVTGADFTNLESALVEGGENVFDVSTVSLNCMARDKALYAGHAVAAVAATSKAIADQACRLIAVDYEVLPHVLTIAEALADGAPLLNERQVTQGVENSGPSNAAVRGEMAVGDAAAAIASAPVKVARRYTSQPVHQGYLEPHACVAQWNADGQAQMWLSSQGGFDIRNMTATVLKIPASDIRVHQLEIGGGFGGKTTIYLEPVAMLLSRKSGRPVRLAMSRQEVFTASGPAPGGEYEVRLGASEDGTLLGAEVEFWYNAGAFPGSSTHSGMMSALGMYRVGNARVVGWDVVTNMANTAAYRAPGAPGVVFAVESAMDELAQQLGMDAIELRLRNAVKPGDKAITGMPFGAIGLVECLEAAKAHPHWSTPLGANEGRGVACGYWGNYGGPSTASASVGPDGHVLITEGNPDIGGSRAAIAMMAAETLQVPYEHVRVVVADTSSIGYSMLTGGSRTTFATGKAVVQACEQIIETCLTRAASLLGVEREEVAWRDGAARCLVKGREGESVDLAELAAKAGRFSGTIAAEVAINPLDYLPGFGVHICDTAVDPETGHVTVTRYTTVQDVGTAIHPDYVEGQMQGGAAQGIGWALNEEYVFDAAGRVDNAGFLDYRMPVCSDLPMIDTVMVEVPNPAHPYGVKGVGEVPIVPPLGAVANAVSRAAGVRMTDLPLSPDRVWRALKG